MGHAGFLTAEIIDNDDFEDDSIVDTDQENWVTKNEAKFDVEILFLFLTRMYQKIILSSGAFWRSENTCNWCIDYGKQSS